MEQVAGRAERLAKEKAKETAPPPFRKRVTKSVKTIDWDPKSYTASKETREERNKKRTIKVFGLEELGVDEYQKLMREIDAMTGSAELDKIVRKRIKEVQERLENERLAREAEEARKTRSQTEPEAGKSSDPTPPAPKRSSPRKKKRTEEPVRKETGEKTTNKRKQPEPDTEQPEDSNRKEKETEKPEDVDQRHKEKGEKRPKPKSTTTTTKPVKPVGPKHIDDEDYDLDIETGRFVRKKTPAKVPTKPTKPTKDDESQSRSKDKDKTKATKKVSDTDDASQSRRKKKAVTFTEQEPEDNDDENDLEIVDDEDLDKDYEPDDEDDDDNGDDEDQRGVDDDLDDFDIPPLRQRKKGKEKVQKIKSKSSTQRRVETTEEGIGDETLSLFQKIVGDSFVVQASKEYEEESKEKRDKCLNPVEAAGFRATMKSLALELKKSVRKGKNIRETYTDMIDSTIRIAKAMNYPGAGQVTTAEIVASIKDMDCHAWRKHLEGKTTMNPEDRYVDEADENPADDDLVVVERMLGQEATDAAAAAIKKLPKMLVNDVNNKLHHLFGEIEHAHRHAAEATKTLRDLHQDVPLDVFLRIADATVRPLVILHIPKTAQLVQKLTEEGVKRMTKIVRGSDNVVDIMLLRNLPVRGDWTTEDECKPQRMIAALVHKYVRDAMLKETTATQTIVDEFNLAKTTIHRQIWGKKYPGGGQKVDTRGEASGSGLKRVAAVILKRSEATEALIQKTDTVAVAKKKGKGTGKSSSARSRTAADIRNESTSEKQKEKAKKRKAEEAELDEELAADPDMPTPKERQAALVAIAKGYTKRGVILH